MICLLFLVSLAVIEYSLRRPEKSSAALIESKALAAKAPTEGLLALGRAVDECGRGPVPEAKGVTDGDMRVLEPGTGLLVRKD